MAGSGGSKDVWEMVRRGRDGGQYPRLQQIMVHGTPSLGGGIICPSGTVSAEMLQI